MARRRRKDVSLHDHERVLHFVRHGEYVSEATQERLTPRGRRQALRIASALRGVPIARFCSSDLARARETADIIAKALRLRPATRHRVLREMLPAEVPGRTVPKAKRADGLRRLTQILRRFFRPSRQHRHEVVVCHGNLIRALVLQITAGNPRGFHRLRIHHGSVTSFVVTPAGTIAVVHFNSITHVPARLRTYA